MFKLASHIGFITLLTVSWQSTSLAKDCKIPSHPECSISCTANCGAIYKEPAGPCRTYCASTVKPATADGISLSVDGLSQQELSTELKDLFTTQNK